jgi:hypothetical protein
VKNTTLILGAFSTVFAATSVYLGAQLGAARDELAAEQQARGADQARIRELEEDLIALETALEYPGDAAPANDVAAAHAGPPPAAAIPETSNVARPPEWRGRRADAAPDTPDVRNARRLQQEVRLRRQLADLPGVLGLNPAEADQLFDLLADARMAALQDARRYADDPIGRQAIEDAARKQRDAAIEALLGPDKAGEFQKFEKSLPARMQVNRIGESMAAANAPLSEAQRVSLVTAVFEEQESKPAPQRPADRDAQGDYEKAYLDWQADYSRRVQARIEPLLSSEQVAQYRQTVQAQEARRAAARARAEARRGSPP